MGTTCNMATIKLHINEYGSIERQYEDEAIINGIVDVDKEIESMKEVLISTDTFFK